MTTSMEQKPSCKADSRSEGKQRTGVYGNIGLITQYSWKPYTESYPQPLEINPYRHTLRP